MYFIMKRSLGCKIVILFYYFMVNKLQNIAMQYLQLCTVCRGQKCVSMLFKTVVILLIFFLFLNIMQIRRGCMLEEQSLSESSCSLKIYHPSRFWSKSLILRRSKICWMIRDFLFAPIPKSRMLFNIHM